MLIIRNDQMAAFADAALRSFEDDMIRHLGDFARRHCELMGADEVRAVVREGIERARGHGFDQRGPVRFYLELMFVFGCDFDTDPLLPWAGAHLAERSDPYQLPRADRLFDAYRDYLEQVVGSDHGLAKRALERIHAEVGRDIPDPGPRFADRLIERLVSIYPEKCTYAGEAGLRQLIAAAEQDVARHQIGTPEGIAVAAGLKFAFGHGCFSDRQFLWIRRTLENPGRLDAAGVVARLRRRSRAYLARVLTHFGRR